jgi:hypothetical protein
MRSELSRFRYAKIVCNCLHYVIVEVSSDGDMEFWSQESGEVRWFPFIPAPEERAAAVSLWRSGGGAVDWPRVRLTQPVEKG